MELTRQDQIIHVIAVISRNSGLINPSELSRFSRILVRKNIYADTQPSRLKLVKNDSDVNTTPGLIAGVHHLIQAERRRPQECGFQRPPKPSE
jgi:hypothetical protein